LKNRTKQPHKHSKLTPQEPYFLWDYEIDLLLNFSSKATITSFQNNYILIM